MDFGAEGRVGDKPVLMAPCSPGLLGNTEADRIRQRALSSSLGDSGEFPALLPSSLTHASTRPPTNRSETCSQRQARQLAQFRHVASHDHVGCAAHTSQQVVCREGQVPLSGFLAATVRVLTGDAFTSTHDPAESRGVSFPHPGPSILEVCLERADVREGSGSMRQLEPHRPEPWAARG